MHPDTRHVTARCCHQKLAGANFSPPCDFKSPEDISLATIWRNIQNQIEINRFLYFFKKQVLTFSLLLRQRFEFLDARPAELSLFTYVLNKIFSLFSRIPLENGTFRQIFREPNIIQHFNRHYHRCNRCHHHHRPFRSRVGCPLVFRPQGRERLNSHKLSENLLSPRG